LLTKPGLDIKNSAMKSQTTGLYTAALIFAIVALGHAVRLLTQSKVIVASYSIPMGISWAALIIAGGLSTWMWRLASARW
jgi:hypothetical protein